MLKVLLQKCDNRYAMQTFKRNIMKEFHDQDCCHDNVNTKYFFDSCVCDTMFVILYLFRSKHTRIKYVQKSYLVLKSVAKYIDTYMV